jgi:predicted negative regulator of RcsB-dependent stress response
VDTQTRHALKHDRFVDTTNSALDWASENRGALIRVSLLVLVVVAVIIAGVWTYHDRQQQAADQLGQAMSIYGTPLRQPGEPADAAQGSYNTAAERAKAAHPLFEEVANKYGWLQAGTDARYFAGLTDLDLGNPSQAETELKQAADTHNSNLASLAKLALANLYAQSHRTQQAIDQYQNLIQHPTTTVPASEAKLQLAELYETSQPAEARRLYAEIKDQDKTTAAGQIAAQKLQTLK